MKTALLLLLGVLSCCFDIPAASKTHGKPAHLTQRSIFNKCLKTYLQSSPDNPARLREMRSSFSQAKSSPDNLVRLQEMGSSSSQDKKKNKQDIFAELRQILMDAGCVGDEDDLSSPDNLVRLREMRSSFSQAKSSPDNLVRLQEMGSSFSQAKKKTKQDIFAELRQILMDAGCVGDEDDLNGQDLKEDTDVTSKLGDGGKGQFH